MKKVTTLFAAILLMAVGATAQKLSYQAVVRNDANELVTETTVQVAVSVLDANNAVQYAETHANVQTNRNGLLSLMVGDGTPTNGTSLADVVWSGASLRAVITLPDNTTITTVTPVNSVPYALYADNVDSNVVSDAIADYITSHNLTLTAAEVQTMINSGLADLQHQFDSLQAVVDGLEAVVDNQNAEIAHLQAQLDSVGLIVDTAITHVGFYCGTSTVTDHEGNVYNTVQIGDQCWTKENLRTTTSPTTGTYLIPPAGTGYTYTGKQAHWYNNDSVTYAPMNYGLLYNWNAAVDTFNTAYGETSVNNSSSNAVSVSFTGHRQGICPAGWHLPSDVEWTAMTNYVSSQSEYLCYSNTNYIAKALADSVGWNGYTNTCAVGNNPSANNATGFSAVPAGRCSGSSFDSAGYIAFFWSSSQSESNPYYAYYRYLFYVNAGVTRYNSDKDFGFSVRCVRD